ncbi:hypothetical protein OB990_20955 [Bacillus cereus]|nr:hypothetical protein [Bacillus cereus]
MKKQDAKQDAITSASQKVATQMTSRDIQPRGDEAPREKTIIRGIVGARHLNSN